MRGLLNQLGICIIIPTYNNINTICRIVDECMQWTNSVIVVNDGSTDGTGDLLSTYIDRGVCVIDYERNKGKGHALKKGFACAKTKGYRYAVTIDADGQHFVSDLPAFIRAIQENPNSLIVGSRNLRAERMPESNTFANKFSNFWFSVQTLQCIPDTQTGYRLYPIHLMGSMWWLTSRYEAELEMLVYAAWHGVKLIPVPIHVYYPKQSERVTHFRPFMDFFRISILNFCLCVLALLYGGPCMMLRKFKG